MKRETLFLKVVVMLMGLPVVALCIFGLPLFAQGAATHYPASVYLPLLIAAYASAIPFFTALVQTFRLLSLIDRNEAFSASSVNILKVIKYCAIAIFVLYAAAAPFLYIVAESDDAPGLLAIGLATAFGSLVIAVFAAVLQKLLNSAIDFKSENDLTI